MLFPIAYAFYISLGDMSPGTLEWSYVGFKNYLTLLQDAKLSQFVIPATLSFAITVAGLETLLALFIALVANEDFRGNSLFRTIILIPYAVSPIVSAVIWRWIYNSQYGMFNYVLRTLKIIPNYKIWLGDVSLAMPAVIIAEVWKITPFFALLLLAALQSIPQELYDAARIDGAGKLERFLHVSLPSIKNTLLIVIILETMWGFKHFETIWALTQGGPLFSTSVLSFYTYQTSFVFLRLGYGGALAILNGAIVGVVILIYVKFLLKE